MVNYVPTKLEHNGEEIATIEIRNPKLNTKEGMELVQWLFSIIFKFKPTIVFEEEHGKKS